MFRQECVIDGLLHYRTTPGGEWTAYTALELTEKIQNLLSHVVTLQVRCDDAESQMRD